MEKSPSYRGRRAAAALALALVAGALALTSGAGLSTHSKASGVDNVAFGPTTPVGKPIKP